MQKYSLFVLALVGSFFTIPVAKASLTPIHFVDAYYDWQNSHGEGIYNSDVFVTITGEPKPSNSGYYWSHTFYFENGGLGYMGLQTNGFMEGKYVGKMAIFSIWNAVDSQPGNGAKCQKFTGEGEGLSCRIKYDWQEGHKYRLRIWILEDSWWGAFIQDVNTGVEKYLGKIKAPVSGRLSSNFVVFQEYYYPSVSSCYAIPYAKATFSDFSANNGSIKAKFGSILTDKRCNNLKYTMMSSGGIIVESGSVQKNTESVKNALYYLDHCTSRFQTYFGNKTGTPYNCYSNYYCQDTLGVVSKIAIPKDLKGNIFYYYWDSWGTLGLNFCE